MDLANSELMLIAVAFLAIIGVGACFAAITGLSRRARDAEERGADAATRLSEAQAALAGRLSQLSDDQRRASAELTQALNDRLDKVSERVGKGLEFSSSNTAKSFGQIKERLKVIDEAQKNLTDLSGEIIGLQDILSNKQTRGAFGEVQLNNLVTSILPPNAYEFQSSLSNGRRADCLITLPNPPGSIAVDAKFPLEGYRAIVASEDDAANKVARRAFSTAILTHVKDIADRYIVPGETAESALMFIPSEAVYAELHANFGDVVEKSYRAKVWIVSPTTLMATLNTVRAILRDVRMREQAGVIQNEVRVLLTDIARLDKRVGNLQGHFSLAEKDIREITTSVGKISSRGQRIEDLQFEDGGEAATVEAPVKPEPPKIVEG